MKQPLVSIITPCYNGEKVMHRLLDSILAQTYHNLEFILVNDGSTDRSEEIWKEYEPKFKQANISTQYIYQQNQGLGGAINAGLKVFHGEYFCWPDIDDSLNVMSIEKRVRFLEEHPNFGSVSSDANLFREDDLEHPYDTVASWMTHKWDEWQFRWLLMGQSIYCCGCHMVRTSCFLDVNPQREIYPARRGQNNQMLLPLYYKYKRGYLDEPLYNYIIYKKSMSTPDATMKMAMDRETEYMQLLRSTLSNIELKQEDEVFCQEQLCQREWDGFSKIYIQYGHPFQLVKLYFRLKIYKTKSKKELKQLIGAIKNAIKTE